MASESCIPLLKALADPTRWGIVRVLLAGPRTVNDLAARLDATQYNVSKHIRILREAGIVQTEKEGQHVECSITENFRSRLTKGKPALDLGCCTFRFDKPPK